MKKIFIILLLITSGCASKIVPPSSFNYVEIPTSYFTLASWQKIKDPNAPYRIYIEGDGYSFNSRGIPTSDPTPNSDLLRKKAFSDPAPNVIYLARPCQYVKDKNCQQVYWTTGRFAPNVINSTAFAIKSITDESDVILIGFSGGAQVAGLIAVLYPDISIKKLITIAGNIDHESWVKHKKLIPLKDSLSLSDYRYEYLKFPQIHYVGGKDDIVPSFLTYNFIGNDKLIKKIPNASHSQGWDSVIIE